MLDKTDRQHDIDPEETREWLESLASVFEVEGPERAEFLLRRVADYAREAGNAVPFRPTTPYVNTIPPEQEKDYPGDLALERRIRGLIRWNAMSLVLRAHKTGAGLGGHIASYQSIATLFEVGFSHFFRAPSAEHGGDLVYFQGHSAEGVYARAFLEGRISEEQMAHFRRETRGPGLSSYPHTWLMPDFWQFATVSMGLGSMQAIYQARFLKYLHNRGIADTSDRKVWFFMGDGESDEPEAMGALAIAAREKLDNLIFVANCNLQRLDGPVRGNGKIIQELDGIFHGAGWNVIKVVWGGKWDPLLARDTDGLLRRRMEECVDGDYQRFAAKGPGELREGFFGKYPELAEMVENMSDEELGLLNRGGHDARKVYAAYAAAVAHTGQPTVILAKTVKGYGMGASGEAMNTTHQQEEMSDDALKAFRERFELSLSDEQLTNLEFYRPDEDSDELRYLKQHREALGGYIPARRTQPSEKLKIPDLDIFDRLLQGSGEREYATTMAFVRCLQMLLRDNNIKERIVPIIPDEARTFGMEGLFRALGIYAPQGQLYEPPDAGQLAVYKEAKSGQLLEEGITEAGCVSSWIAAGTSYSTSDLPMIPFFAFYSMFGYQRIGDFLWAAADMRTRGFLMGGTSGRTTMNGEGLQHEDGHSHVLFSVVPSCRAYDPTFAYEMAVIIHHGLKQMYVEGEDVYYYITMMNEDYAHPPMPEGVEDGIISGMYLFQQADRGAKRRVQLLGSGAILREAIAAADLLKRDWQVSADVWSAPGITQLCRDGRDAERWNMLHPDAEPRQSYVAACLEDRQGPVIAATDYIRTYPEQIRPFVPKPYYTLGTDGYGRSDTRENLRQFFEVDRRWIAVTALKALADQGDVEKKTVAEAIEKYRIDSDKPNPVTV
jgi:pyruvate dehydrogenase E1 component